MSLLYKNPQLGERLARMPALPRHLVRPEGDFERVLTLSFATDGESGMAVVMLSLDELGEGPGGYPTVLAVYPFDQQLHAQEDALLVSRKLGFRLRRATPHVGWQWVRTDADMLPPDRRNIEIGG